MANFLSGIISLTLSVVVLSGVFISTVKGVNQSYQCANATGQLSNTCSWTAGEIALWGLLTISAVAGLVNFVRLASLKSKIRRVECLRDCIKLENLNIEGIT